MAYRFFTAAGRILVVLSIIFGNIPQASASYSQIKPESNKASWSEQKPLQNQLSADPTSPLAISGVSSLPPVWTPARLPVSFVPNKGQIKDNNVKFQSSSRGGDIFFKPGEIHLVMSDYQTQSTEMGDDTSSKKPAEHVNRSNPPFELKVKYQGFNGDSRVVGINELPGKMHYLVGANQADWVTDVETYDSLIYEDFYPGINLQVNGKDGQIKTSFVVFPHADPTVIQWGYQGNGDIVVDDQGNLLVTVIRGNDTRTLKETAPIAWQTVNGETRSIPVAFTNDGNTVSFILPNGYDPTAELVIDPTIVWASYLGNNGTDQGFAVDRDSSGNIIVGGYSSCYYYPLTPNKYQGRAGGYELVISKLDPTGTTLLYSTCLGGPTGDEQLTGMAVDSASNIIVSTSSNNGDFPIVNGMAMANNGYCENDGENCEDMIVAKLSAAGNELLYSTYIGGTQDDDSNGVAVGSDGKIYMIGRVGSSDFPTTANAYQPAWCEGWDTTNPLVPADDMVVVKINPNATGLAALEYSTYLGGMDWDDSYGIAVDSNNKVYVVGDTWSLWDPPLFPLVNPIYASTKGSEEITLSKFDMTQSGSASLVFSTLLGGNSTEQANAVAVDTSGMAYITGYTKSNSLLATTGAAQTTYGGSQDAFVTKINTVSRQIVYTTYLGSSEKEEGQDIAIDSSGNAYVTGYTYSSNYPTVNPIQTRPTGTCSTSPCQDAFVTVLDSIGSSSLFSTYLGGGGNDVANAIMVDTSGNIFVVGSTWSSNFPVTTGSYDPTNDEANTKPSIFVAKIGAVTGNRAPTDISLSNSSVSENQPGGTTIGTLSATDPDAGNTLTFSLVSGTGADDNASFTISGDQLQAATSFDFEAKSSYSILVRVTDSGSLTYDEVFIITVSNVNEPPTDIQLSNNQVDENQSVGTMVGTLTTTDPDMGDTFTYSLVGGVGADDNGSFTITGNQLQTAASFDFEVKSSYSIRVKVTDAGGLAFEDVFIITVTSLNVTLTLDAAEPYIVPGTTATTSWHIAGIDPAVRPVTLKFYLPERFTPAGSTGSFDAANAILSLTVASANGQVDWNVDGAAVGPYTITGKLFVGSQEYASASMTLDQKYEFTNPTTGGVYTSGDGTIQVSLPAGAIETPTTLLIGDPSEAAMPAETLSDQTFEVLAIDQSTGQEVHTLAQPATITTSYSEEIPMDAEGDMAMYYYNPDTELWERLPSTVDPVNNTVSATTSHFSVFDIKVEDWQASDLPTVANFQVSQFTGAATYAVELEAPAGPLGLQPNLSVSYNSQTVDGGSSITQASWVGMGWTLDTGYIERDTNGTPSNTNDDTYTVVYGGVSSPLLRDSGGKWHIAEENFWRVERSGETWYLWDKAGSKFTFGEDNASRGLFAACQGGSPWRYALSRVTNTFGKSLTYSYSKDGKTINGCSGSMDTAIYPNTILYPSGRYRVLFTTADRGDYDPSELSFFNKKKLTDVTMQWDSNGAGSWQNIRSYHFSYYNDSAQEVGQVIFPNYAWKGPGSGSTIAKHTLTLKSIQERGENGGSLPATTFQYGDGMHLTHANNGYNGTVDFVYELWYGEFAPPSTEKKQDIGANKEPCSQNPTDGALGKWALRTQDGSQNTNLFCQGGKLLAFKEITNPTFGTEPFKPGRLYKIEVQAKVGTNTKVNPAQAGSWLDLGLLDGSQSNYQYGSYPQYYGSGYYSNRITLTGTMQTYKVFRYLPANASKLNLLMNTNGVELDYYSVVPLPTYYRVKQKTIDIDDGNPSTTPYTYTYAYQGAAINTEANSAGVTTSNPLREKYSEFRGHQMVTETGPDNKRVVITWFNQTDDLKGKEDRNFVTEQVGSGAYKVFTEKATFYSVESIATSTANMPNKNNQPVTDLGIRWVQVDSSASCAYNTNGNGISYNYTGNAGSKPCYYQDQSGANTVGQRTSMQYDTAANYGNLLSSTTAYWNGTTWVNYRVSQIDYTPVNITSPTDISTATYLVEVPAWQKTFGCNVGGINCTTLLTATYNYYDAITTNDVQPSAGHLTRVRTLMSSLSGVDQYSQVDYSNFDAWGNARTETTYSGYITLSSSGAPAGLHSQTNEYDNTYGTYLVTSTNAKSHVTQMGYDYRMGVLTSMTDPNGIPYSAEYDEFGRIWRVNLPGDTQTSTEMTYFDNERPFRVQVKQWIIGSTYFTLSRSYDAIGRMVRMTTVGAAVDGTVADVKTDYTFDEYGRIKTQTVPYTTETNPPGTTNEYDVLGRRIRKIAPNGDDLLTTYVNVNTAADPLGGTGLVPGQQTTVQDAAGRNLITLSDPLDRVLSVTPPIGSGVTYTYDLMGNLKTALYTGQMTVLKYDYTGRKIGMDDPGMGTAGTTSDDNWGWMYEYDALGNMTKQTDARRCVSTMAYDDLNRLTGTTYSGPDRCATTTALVMTFDQGNDKGRLNNMTDSSGTRSWVYDERGRVKIERYSIDNTFTYEVKYEYAADRLEYAIYPDGEKVSFTYNPQKELVSITGEQNGQVTSYVNSTIYDASGRITTRSLGANLFTSSFGYNPWTEALGAGKPSSVTLTRNNGGVTLQNLSYTYYDNTGNIETITDHLALGGTGSQIQHFTYDDLDRLQSASATGGSAADGAYSDEMYVYDSVSGDLKQKANLTLYYNDPNHAHAVTSTSSGNTYTYDANGNQITRAIAGDGTYTLQYDATNRLVEVMKAPAGGGASTTVKYIYDGQGKLVVKKTSSEETVYVGEYYERTFPLVNGQIQADTPVPFKTILPFAASSCPAGWVRISGDGESFNHMFLQGAPAGAAPGVEGGQEFHSHIYTDIPSHTHTAGNLATNSISGHTHAVTLFNASGYGNIPQAGTVFQANGTTSSNSHFHDVVDTSTTAAAGITNPTTSTTTTLPPYVDMLFCRKDFVDFLGVPKDAVIIFDLGAGQQLPAGWTHFSPLDGKFPRGAAVYNGTGGGSDTHYHSYSQVPSHNHAAGSGLGTNTYSHNHTYGYMASNSAFSVNVGPYLHGSDYSPNGNSSTAVESTGGHDHTTISGQTNPAGTNSIFNTNTTSNLPPYKEVPYAQKTVADGLEFPISSVMIWQGSQCPDASWQEYTVLDGLFPRGAAYVNATGGSASHTHTYTGLPSHTHGPGLLDVAAVSNHTHSFEFATSSSGTGTARVYGSDRAGSSPTNILSSAEGHSHTFTGSTAAAGVATPTTQSGSNLPPYTTVTFCKKISAGQYQGGGSSTVRKYYFTDEDRVAMRENGTLYFLANDHLGSTSIVIDANGNKVAEMRYKPWGETRYESGSMPTDYLYTGKRNNEETGLYYYDARWYDTTLGRFAQADTNIPAHQGTQGWDRFAYVNNNPLQYTDSTGQWIETAFDILSLAMTINDIRNEGFTVMNTISLVTDVAAVVLPVVPAGVSHALRAAKYASKAVNAVDTAADTAKAVDKLADAAKFVDDVCSFSADTQVSTREGSKDISAIEVGDYVLAWNEGENTLSYYEVTATFSHEDEVLTELIVNGEWIETTPEHPFNTEESGWLAADELKPGMHIRQADGDYAFVWLKWNIHKKQEMYNLTVDTAHTFFVGEGQWLVHNSCKDRLEALANTAAMAHRQLEDRLKDSVVAAAKGTDGKPILAVYHKFEQETIDAVKALRDKGWEVLDAPVRRGPEFHAERQLAAKGHTEIGISRQKGMCDFCKVWQSKNPQITVWEYRKRWR